MAFPPFSLSPLSQSIGPHPKKEERQVSQVQSPRLAPRSTLSGHLCPRAQALALDQWVVPAFLCAHGGRLGRTPQDPRPQPSHRRFPFLPAAAPGESELVSDLTHSFKLDRQVEFSFLEKCK